MGENASPTSSNEPEDSGDRGCEDPEWNGDHEERRVELRCGRVNRTCQSIMLAVCFCEYGRDKWPVKIGTDGPINCTGGEGREIPGGVSRLTAKKKKHEPTKG